MVTAHAGALAGNTFPLLTLNGAMVTTGQVFFVDSGNANASDDNVGNREDLPLATLDAAFNTGKVIADNGDIVYVMAGHSQTVTTAITTDVAGVSIVGLGVGRSKPAFDRSGTIDCFDITAANIKLVNLRIFDTADTAGSLVNINAADFEMQGCVLEHGVGPLVAVTVVAAADRFTIQGCTFRGTADGPDVAIDFEGEVDDWTVEDCTFNYSPDGIDLAVIRADANVVPGGSVHNCKFICVSAPFIDFDSSDTLSGDGMLSNIVATIGPTTTPANIDTAVDQGGYVNVNVFVSKAVDDAGSRIPVATGA